MTEYEAGRQLDRLIHERVMGLSSSRPAGTGSPYDYIYVYNSRLYSVCRYSTDMTHAWRVVEKLNLLVIPDVRYTDEGTYRRQAWVAGLFDGYFDADTGIVDGHLDHPEHPHMPCYAVADTPALAICRAALKVVEMGLLP